MNINYMVGVNIMNNMFIKACSLAPRIELGRPMENVKIILAELNKLKKSNPHFIVLPELCVTGYSCGDLFFQEYLLQENDKAIRYFLKHNDYNGIIILGAVYVHRNNIFNCAYVIYKDQVLGIVPKTYLPNNKEYYEARQFASGAILGDGVINVDDYETTFGRQLFYEQSKGVSFGVEICEDMWAPISPATYLAMAGAEIIFNLSASNEVLDKDETRRYIIKSFTQRNKCAYVYASSGRFESTQDTVYSNHCIISSLGNIINESTLFNNDTVTLLGDIDLGQIKYLKRKDATNREALKLYFDNVLSKSVNCDFTDDSFTFETPISRIPFIPEENHEEAYKKILSIQVASLARRIQHVNAKNVLLGLSGGLDSTLALIVLYKTFEYLNMDKQGIKLITMPGPGTSERTLKNACNLAKGFGLDIEIIEITEIVMKELELLKHDFNNKDVTYENTQARMRTSILFNKANQLNGFVLGTGDLSELALGWCTFNGDHMSNYSVNSGLPKTLIRFMVNGFLKYEQNVNELLKDTLSDILDTPISPELSGKDQKTEDIIGKYEIHDFIMYRFLIAGDSEERIDYLMNYAFPELSAEERKNYLKTFFKRFFSQQFKRSVLPDGPKVLSISLSPRSDWRMPSDIYYID